MILSLPRLSLVVLIGPSGAGKSSFAQKHFRPTEILSSDACRAMVADDSADQSATGDAFAILRRIASTRLARGKLTVIDATNVRPEARRALLDLARDRYVGAVAIVLDMPERLCLERQRERPSGPPRAVIRRQHRLLRQSVDRLRDEGFLQVHRFTSPESLDELTVERAMPACDRSGEKGPFDVIGDVHGCCDELEILLAELGYAPCKSAEASKHSYAHPAGRKAVFVGDLVDRGPRSLDALQLVQSMIDSGAALCVRGNHEARLLRLLDGKDVAITHGLGATLQELEALEPEPRARATTWISSFARALPSHYVLDAGRLVVAHAGVREQMQGRESPEVLDFALFGETTGESAAFGLPQRVDWALEYRGAARVAYGHLAVAKAEWLNGTIDLDTGCVFGGRLTALRYPEMELVAVPAARQYTSATATSGQQADAAHGLTAQQRHDAVLQYADVAGRRTIATRLAGRISITEEQAAAALEVVSRFAVDPRWLVYLPPTMAPCDASREARFLEHPREAFEYYREQGVQRLICEQKHMGSRAIAVVCRDDATAIERFGIAEQGAGSCYSRTGRRFFDAHTERAFLEKLRAAVLEAGLWETLHTSWVCLDCEIMPWSYKAEALISQQYDVVGVAGAAGLAAALDALENATERSIDAGTLPEQYRQRSERIAKYTAAYAGYRWPVGGVEDLRVAPFQLLASENRVHTDRDHLWHMDVAQALSEAAPGFVAVTPYQVVDPTDPEGCLTATTWWEEITAAGIEGMVVKPIAVLPDGADRRMQPALKCRGREYLRMVYGPEYTDPKHLDRLKQRSSRRKKSLALREYALGIEALERFVRRDPLRYIHECVLGVLALESESVDPRL